jgi:hypothetical protein
MMAKLGYVFMFTLILVPCLALLGYSGALLWYSISNVDVFSALFGVGMGGLSGWCVWFGVEGTYHTIKGDF